MYILALETTGPVGSAALIDERGQITEAVSGEAMNHLKDLMPMAKRLLDQRDVCQGDLTAAAASVGPGSFTGIRIGVTSARAICQALDIPAISVPTLDSFKVKCDGRTVIAPIINARRGQVYGAVFGEDGSDILKSGPYMLTDVFDAIRTELDGRSAETACGIPVAGRIVFYGDGIDAYGSELAEFTAGLAADYCSWQAVLADEEERYQRASMTAACALEKYRDGHLLSVEQLLPEYMRATEAEQKLADGTLERQRAAKMARFRSR